MAPDNGSDSVRSVARAFSLLALFGEEHPTRSLNELVEAAEIDSEIHGWLREAYQDSTGMA